MKNVSGLLSVSVGCYSDPEKVEGEFGVLLCYCLAMVFGFCLIYTHLYTNIDKYIGSISDGDQAEG